MSQSDHRGVFDRGMRVVGSDGGWVVPLKQSSTDLASLSLSHGRVVRTAAVVCLAQFASCVSCLADRSHEGRFCDEVGTVRCRVNSLGGRVDAVNGCGGETPPWSGKTYPAGGARP